MVTKDKTISEKRNIEDNVDNCKSVLNRWLQRDLSFFGRILLTKMDSLSRLIYPAYSLPIAPHIVKTINKLNFDFIWRNKCHYIAKQDLIRTYEDGGGNAIDFDCMNGMLKIR